MTQSKRIMGEAMKSADALYDESDDSSDDLGLGYCSKKDRMAAANRKRVALTQMYSSSSSDEDSSDDISFSDDLFCCKPRIKQNKKSDCTPAAAHPSRKAISNCTPDSSDDQEIISPARSTKTASATISKTASFRAQVGASLQAVKSAKAALMQAQRYRAEDVNLQSLPSIGRVPFHKNNLPPILGKNSKRSRLSWDPRIASDFENHHSKSDSEESTGGEEHPLIREMRAGVTDALVNTIVQVIGRDTYQAIVSSVVDSTKYSYSVKKISMNDATNRQDGVETELTIELNPTQYGAMWSIIGKRTTRGRISMKRSFDDKGEVNATGVRQGSSTAPKKRRRVAIATLPTSLNTPAVVRQERTMYENTPKKGSKRQNDLKLQARHAIGKISAPWFPHHTPNSRVNMVTNALGSSEDEDASLVSLAKTLSNTMNGLKPKRRRQLMSIFAGSKRVTRTKAEQLLGFKISTNEWRQAGNHFLYPGPTEKPLVYKSSRQRFKIDDLLAMIGHVDDEHLQRLAYGANSVETVHGNIIQIDAVESTANSSTIARDYYNKVNPDGRKCGENQCEKRHCETKHFCLLTRGHEGRCKFTPEDAISAEALRKFLSNMTSGQQKSFQGLDDEMVYKGTNNVERLLEIYGLIAIGESEADRKMMKERIENILLWHKSGFRFHLERHGERCCQCISCGFHSASEPISCPFRGRHKEACHDCEESFQVISDLKRLAQKGKEREGLTDAEREKFHELGDEIERCRKNLFEYRAHIVRKKVEGKFQREQLQSMTSTEAIVVCDYKMKINPMRKSEAQNQFYSQRGTTCCGFLLYTKAEAENEVYAEYFYFFCDDSCQDANMVLAAKSYIYSEHLPTLFPEGTSIEVKWETDGAGCFNSNLLKACQPLWYTWTDGNVEEIQIRHSVNGDGKSPLDGSFGKMTKNFKDTVSTGGKDIYNAATCLKAFQSGPGIKNAAAVLLHLNREDELKLAPGKGESLLLRSHRLVLDRKNEKVTCYSYSGYGEGTTIPFSTYEKMLPKSSNMPFYRVTEGEDDHSCKEIVTHSTESNSSRVVKMKKARTAKKREKADAKFFKIINDAKQNNLFICPQRREGDLAPCRKQFRSQRALELHISEGKHHFTGQNLIVKSAMLVSGQGGSLAVGRRMNRNEEHFSDDCVKDGVGAGTSDGSEWKDEGCYRKRERNKPTQKSQRLIKELKRMFELGESDNSTRKSKNKYSPQMALDELKEMKNPSGMLTFSATSIYGRLPTIEQIRSFFSACKQLKSKGETGGCTEEDNEELLEFVMEGGKIISSSSSNERQGELMDLCFFLDGEFEDKKRVQAAIEALGGKVLGKWSKKTDFIVQGMKPKKKEKDVNPSTRYTNWDKIQLLQNGSIFIEALGVPPIATDSSDKKSKKKSSAAPRKTTTTSTHFGKLNGIRFLLDGDFEDKDHVKSTIEKSGGKVLQRKSKLTQYIVQGTNPKIQAAISEPIITSWDKLELFLKGKISIEDLPMTGSTFDSKPASVGRKMDNPNANPNNPLNRLSWLDDSIPNDDWLEVAALVNGKRPADDVVLKLTHKVELTQADMNRLVGPRPIGHQQDIDLWLNDKVMGGLRHVLREMNAELRSREETFFADTYFYTHMMEQRNACEENRDKFTYKSVERRCKKSPRNNLLLHRASYFPILLNENHWIGATIINGDKKIGVFNPSGKKKENEVVLDNLFKLVEAEYDRLDDKSCIDMDGWSLIDISPDDDEDLGQRNCYDCGVFTILFMFLHSQDLPISFTQDDVYNSCDGRGVRSKLAHLLWKWAKHPVEVDLSQDE